jgi:L-ascorbate metabolism protein UlaG (beta-lactamase superfamily)
VNPVNPDGQKELDTLDKADLVLVTHGHFDHVGNAVEIAKKTGAKLVTTFDLGNALVAFAGYPKEQAGYDSLGNFGGTLDFLGGDVTVTFIPAVHSSSVVSKQDVPEYGGNPGGFLITVKDGPTFYHTGDTDLFGDMRLIPQFHSVDIMLTCIGGHFTMGPDRAAEAVALVRPRRIVPMHYGTFPQVMPGTVTEFNAALNKRKLKQELLPLVIGKATLF